MNRILVIAAHPDDEVLGCGGVIAKHTHEGSEVFIAFMTNGVSSRECEEIEKNIDLRKQASIRALKNLNITNYKYLNFPDNKMDSVPLLDVVKSIELLIDDFQPNIIYTHYHNDLNIDHRVTNRAVITATRPQSNCCVKKILTFEILSSTEWTSSAGPHFIPNYIVDVSNYWSKKMDALECYIEEMRDHPHSRSFDTVNALATLRGATNGYKKAEAFFVERILED
jgi:N-acetylglucosamine malate deacetylase 1